MSILIIAEHNNQNLKPVIFNTITAALQMNQEINVLIAGYQCDTVFKQLQNISGIKKIFLADNKVYQYPIAETLTPLILSVLSEEEYIIAPASTFGKNLMPRIAGSLGVSQISDVTEIIAENIFLRPLYAGNVYAKIQSHDKIKCLTIRPSAFPPAQSHSSQTIAVEKVDFVSENSLSFFVTQTSESVKEVELASAEIVIGGGRGLGSKENFLRLKRIAQRLGAGMGATRAAVDMGLAPNELQIGQTGHIIAPKIYIAVGISGAIQHLSGMKDSGIIIAINSDANAPIFEIADFGLVGDIETILPEWEKNLNDEV